MTMNGMFPDEKDRPPTLDGMVACAKRELKLREVNYPRWVQGGRMKQHSADNEIKNMRGILHVLLKLQELPRGLERLEEAHKSWAAQNEQAMEGLKTFNAALGKSGLA